MDNLGLGEIITTEQQRDAVHVAIAPMEAAENLRPGEHVGITQDGKASARDCAPIGVVDPFLRHYVRKGERFWMFLYPGTITSLRHEWEHAAFGGKAPPLHDAIATSVKWIEEFAARLDLTYNRLMGAAALWVEDYEFTRDDSETYKDHWDDFPEFWKHYEVVTGKKPKDGENGSFFTCSC